MQGFFILHDFKKSLSSMTYIKKQEQQLEVPLCYSHAYLLISMVFFYPNKMNNHVMAIIESATN